MTKKTTFKIHPDFPNYHVYENGKVYSISSNKFLSQDTSNSYARVNLRNKKGFKRFFVHRLVAKLFLNLSKYEIINHKDGNKLNNHYINLEWCSYSYNLNYAYKTKLRKIRVGEKMHTSKLKIHDVRNNFKLRNQGLTHQKIADTVGTTRSNISLILKGTSWKHIWKEYNK